jgi:glycosyltransferase involved in cell wall biosynthesis
MKTVVFDMTILDTPTRVRGTARYVRELARGLASMSAEERDGLRLVALTRLGWDGTYEATEDLASFAGSAGMPRPTERDHYAWAYKRRLLLANALRRMGADVVHLTDATATPLGMSFVRTLRVVSCLDAIPLLYPARYLGWKDGGPFVGTLLERRRYRSADLVVAISDAVRDDAVRLLGVHRERIVRVYPAIDEGRWTRRPDPERESATLARLALQRPFVLYIGGPDWHKNVEGMLGGLANARTSGADVDLVWVGELGGPRGDRVRELALAMGVSDAVRFVGFVDDAGLLDLLRRARAHILVSHTEGFGYTVVEAMAAGCPVITTRAGSLAEVAGDAALTVNGDDHAAIGAAIARVAVDEELRADLIERGRRRPRAFGPEAQARAMIAAYRQALAAPRGRDAIEAES